MSSGMVESGLSPFIGIDPELEHIPGRKIPFLMIPDER